MSLKDAAQIITDKLDPDAKDEMLGFIVLLADEIDKLKNPRPVHVLRRDSQRFAPVRAELQAEVTLQHEEGFERVVHNPSMPRHELARAHMTVLAYHVWARTRAVDTEDRVAHDEACKVLSQSLSKLRDYVSKPPRDLEEQMMQLLGRKP